MRLLILVLLAGCATTSLQVTRQCKDGRLVQVVKPVVKNAALQRLVLDNRTREACND